MNEIYKKFGFKYKTSDYGYRVDDKTNQHEFHPGIDLVKGDKAPIGAFVAGQVLFAGFGKHGTGLGDYGNVVAIKDKHSALHVYGHLDSVSVEEGQIVKVNQEIGKQGNTGASDGSHLHYEVRRTFKPRFGWSSNKDIYCYNPTEYLNSLDSSEIAVVANKVVESKEKVYTVKSGDTLSEIAVKHNVTMAKILKLNSDIKDLSKIKVGQKIKLG
jgi:murein DD-endopeptidase MepM/ murein hydrolase activator NlpD